MLTNLKKSAAHLLMFLALAIIHVDCTKKQAATTANTTTTTSTTTTTTQGTATGSQSASGTADLQKYTGRYDIASDEIGWAEVTLENNKLYGESEGRPKTELIQEGEDKFRVEGVDATITFTRDNQQQVNGLVISYQGYNIKGEKVK
jgi:GH35 family endo-1,4-beta-xylanase